MSWPDAKVVALACSQRISEVIRTPLGNGRGIRSSEPWIYFIAAGPRSFVHCEKCGDAPQPPDPPGSGAPGEPRNPLVAPGTKAHALFLLTWLHQFSKEHQHETSESPTT